MKKVKVGSKSSPTVSDANEDASSTDKVLFWINKSGFTLSDHVWGRMFDHASKHHPGGYSSLSDIKNSTNAPPVRIHAFLCTANSCAIIIIAIITL